MLAYSGCRYLPNYFHEISVQPIVELHLESYQYYTYFNNQLEYVINNKNQLSNYNKRKLFFNQKVGFLSLQLEIDAYAQALQYYIHSKNIENNDSEKFIFEVTHAKVLFDTIRIKYNKAQLRIANIEARIEISKSDKLNEELNIAKLDLDKIYNELVDTTNNLNSVYRRINIVDSDIKFYNTLKEKVNIILLKFWDIYNNFLTNLSDIHSQINIYQQKIKSITSVHNRSFYEEIENLHKSIVNIEKAISLMDIYAFLIHHALYVMTYICKKSELIITIPDNEIKYVDHALLLINNVCEEAKYISNTELFDDNNQYTISRVESEDNFIKIINETDFKIKDINMLYEMNFNNIFELDKQIIDLSMQVNYLDYSKLSEILRYTLFNDSKVLHALLTTVQTFGIRNLIFTKEYNKSLIHCICAENIALMKLVKDSVKYKGFGQNNELFKQNLFSNCKKLILETENNNIRSKLYEDTNDINMYNIDYVIKRIELKSMMNCFNNNYIGIVLL